MIGTAFIKRWPRAFCYAIIGLIAGALIGLFIGGVGVTMRGGAFRIYTELVLAIAGAFVGYRMGIKRGRIRKFWKNARKTQ